ncbi:MAG: KH domain-containing protein [Clostridia bacterium]|nr:KH domain-containing protein [Clostridia bacterium]MBQ2327447.1 KH domain-containing protein [Clostridia bacterium]MBQ2690864.1 KH domain-containing protein [Clostridia bacterium]MBQ5813865.1 KH domain-containing protein [Clostridia bacterium]
MESTNLKEILSYIVENLVENPSAISIETVEKEDTITLQLKVAESDMGKVIGRQGRIAKEIRTIIKAAGLKDHKKVLVDILD